MEDICDNIDIGQFGGQAGMGTEHLMVCLLDRILQLLDKNTDRSAVIMKQVDWSAAFDRQDPTKGIEKFIKLGVRPSLIPLLASYLTDRRMKVKFNGEMSEFLTLIGGGPQGTLLGQIEYLVQSNDNADIVSSNDRFKYIDDLSVLQLVCMAGLLIEYDFTQHVASDIAVGDKFLPVTAYQSQDTLDFISNWTNENLMQINPTKCNYMVFSRSEEKFSTRLKINSVPLNRVRESKILGLYISDNLSWDRNCKEICMKAFSRMQMITKLRYAGVGTEDLIEIYVLYIRSTAEYCSTAFHSTLTTEQSNKIERIQKTSLKIILGDMYIDYESALEMSGLETLFSRRAKRCLDFALKCTQHSKNSRLFPLNNKHPQCPVKKPEKYVVNFAKTTSYLKTTIPFCQRLLNKHHQGLKK